MLAQALERLVDELTDRERFCPIEAMHRELLEHGDEIFELPADTADRLFMFRRWFGSWVAC